MAGRGLRDAAVLVTDRLGITARRIPGNVTGIHNTGQCVALDVPGGPYVVFTSEQWNDLAQAIRERPWDEIKGK